MIACISYWGFSLDFFGTRHSHILGANTTCEESSYDDEDEACWASRDLLRLGGLWVIPMLKAALAAVSGPKEIY